ncbi:chloride channel protein [Alphaproteobacteria bacterium KMM 3653]|uniref:Chloride channel protein n=1 Tax=Harenicola maris TaxID=2841044 RepID=A0AAP2CNB8_9RHOB|nr:chloride channel protein [Harenicola maris]
MRRVMRVLRERGPSKIQFWFIALFIGIAAGLAASAFRVGVSLLQTTLYGAESVETIHSFARTLPWYWVFAIPVMGGLLVGVILHRYTPDGRVRSVADVIEGAALNNGRVERRAGIASAMASLITLSSGGSTGREGPVVHIAGLISTWVSNRLNANGITGRDLLGCAVAAAVSASFNAPLAGALFALEVVLRHFAVHAFAPIAIASVAGAVVSRLEFGDVAQFSARGGSEGLGFYVELPAFLMLGLICGLVAVVLMRSIFWADDFGSQVQARIGLPRWIRPALAGGMLGAIAIWYPHIIGVGYETTVQALQGGLLLHEALVFVVIKVIAVVITMAGRMGGGVFSPSLMIGALAGLGFGLVATAVFPTVSSGGALYALAGMGAVAAAVLGAPISTTLIVFELTGDWQTGLAVMVAVSASTAVASKIVDRSFFLTQLERRGSRIAAGPQQYLLGLYSAAYIMRSLDSPRAAPEPRCRAMIEGGLWIAPDTTLETLLPMLEESDDGFIPVLAPASTGGQGELMGAVFHVDALRAYNRALAETAAEEHS